jgi:hypothetical protein
MRQHSVVATWIAHLRVAERVHTRIPQTHFDQFLAGSIAPDSGVLAADNKSYVPPSQVSHYIDPKRPKWTREDLRFHAEHVRPTDISTPDGCFMLGYYCHLLLDNMWSHYIWRPAKLRHANQRLTEPIDIQVHKTDWYGQDRIFLNNNHAWPIWRLFRQTICGCDRIPFYTSSTITNKIRDIVRAYELTAVPDHLGRYLTAETMDAFVDFASQFTIEAIYLAGTITAATPGSILDHLAERHRFLDRPVGDLYSDRHQYM